MKGIIIVTRFFRWFGLPGRFVLTLLMSGLSVLLAFYFPSVPHFIAAGAMLLSSLGDILLMNFRPVTRLLPFRGFKAGSAVFTLAHLTYASAFGYKIYKSKLSFFNAGVVIAFAIFVTLVLLTVILTFLRHSDGINMLAPGMIYLLVISINCAAIFSCAFSMGGLAIVSSVGILSFLTSDYFIMLDKVCGVDSKTLNELIWWFYPIGQILLLVGV